jgi:hypothetical protein
MKRVPFRADRPECEMTSECYAGGAWGFTVVSSQWDESDEVQQALRAIVSDPAYGVGALSSSQIMANLLKDLLPDAPREVSILVAAAEADVASNRRDRVSQGMDVGTASARRATRPASPGTTPIPRVIDCIRDSLAEDQFARLGTTV